MTDLKHLPKGYDEPLNKMTEKEWEEYFALRKELDVDMSKEDILLSFKKDPTASSICVLPKTY